MKDMTAHGTRFASRFACGGPRLALCAIVLMMSAGHLRAQQAPPPLPGQPTAPVVPSPAPPAAAAPAETAPAKKEGFLDAIERWWDKSASDFKASVDESKESWRKLNERNEKAARDAAAAAKEAAEALSKLSGARIVDGREVCEVAPNGSPDCNVAAEKICKAKGFGAGKSADIQTNRKCSARAWLSGNPAESACIMETVVTKAACQ
jgi:hypothetical protein